MGARVQSVYRSVAGRDEVYFRWLHPSRDMLGAAVLCRGWPGAKGDATRGVPRDQ